MSCPNRIATDNMYLLFVVLIVSLYLFIFKKKAPAYAGACVYNSLKIMQWRVLRINPIFYSTYCKL